MSIEKFEAINPVILYDNKIFDDYINRYEKLKDFFPFPPKFETLQKTAYTERNGILIKHLLEYNQKFHANDKTLDNIKLLKDPETRVVVTGQQPGPLIGPLYTIYKTITAIILTQNLSKKFNKNFVPLFWMESSDSNFANQSTFFSIDSENKLRDFSFPFLSRTKDASFSKISLDIKSVKTFLSSLSKNLEGEKKEEIFNSLEKTITLYPNFVDLFASLMTLLFSTYGLVLIDPQQPVIQQLSKPVFKREIENPCISPSIVKETGDKLTGKGYNPSLKIFPNTTFLFLEENGGREKLTFSSQNFRTENTGYSKENLLSLLEEHPELFSPNVALRPIIQDFLLKTYIYVAGPNEIAYWAQLKELYGCYNITFPMVFPRMGATLIPSFISELMSYHELSFLDFKNRLDKRINFMVKESPELKAAFNYLFPQQVPQERRLNMLQFLVKYGLGLTAELINIFSSNNQQKTLGSHFLIYL